MVIAALGGTIAMVEAPEGGVSPQLQAADLVAAVPQLERVAAVRPRSLRTVPGAHLSFDDVLDAAADLEGELGAGADGFVITQGTDTIEETAFLLDLVWSSERPLVVTGAMRNPALAGSDGPANLLAAVQVAASSGAAGLGVTVVMNDSIHAAPLVRKTSRTSPATFASSPGELGWLAEGHPVLLLRPAPHLRIPRDRVGPSIEVARVTISLGDDGRQVTAAPDLGFAGVVLEAMGGGHVPPAVAAAVETAAAKMPVVLAARPQVGSVLRDTYSFRGSERDLLSIGAIPAGWLDGPKARVLLTLLLRTGASRSMIEEAFMEFS